MLSLNYRKRCNATVTSLLGFTTAKSKRVQWFVGIPPKITINSSIQREPNSKPISSPEPTRTLKSLSSSAFHREEESIFIITIPSLQGQSGSPLILKTSEQDYFATGIHIGNYVADPFFNVARKIDEDLINRLLSWNNNEPVGYVRWDSNVNISVQEYQKWRQLEKGNMTCNVDACLRFNPASLIESFPPELKVIPQVPSH